MTPSELESPGPRFGPPPARRGADLSTGEVERLLQLARRAEPGGDAAPPLSAPSSARDRRLLGLVAPHLARSAAADWVWTQLRQLARPGDRDPRAGAFAFDLAGNLLSACASARRLCEECAALGDDPLPPLLADVRALSRSGPTAALPAPAVKEHLFRRGEGRVVRSRASRAAGADRVLVVLEAIDLAPSPVLAQGEAPDPEQRVRAAGLTGRERAVARLVGRGLSNGEAAQRLRVRSSTIAEHLTNVFRKLGVANRVELIRLLTRP